MYNSTQCMKCYFFLGSMETLSRVQEFECETDHSPQCGDRVPMNLQLGK